MPVGARDALAAVRAAGAEHAIVPGSGPTVVGIWWGDGRRERALGWPRQRCATSYPGAVVATPVAAEFGAAVVNLSV